MSYSSYAQNLKGYVVTLEGDTIHGTIAKNINKVSYHNRIKFYDRQGKKYSYYPKHIQGYAIGKTRYISSKGGIKNYFYKAITEGTISLYYFMIINGNVFSEQLFWRKNGIMSQVYPKNRNSLLEYLGDDPEIAEEIKSAEKKEINIQQLVAKYNTRH